MIADTMIKWKICAHSLLPWCIHFFVSVCPLEELLQAGSVSLFLGPSDGLHSHSLLLDEERGHLLLGARDHIYLLDPDNLGRTPRKVHGLLASVLIPVPFAILFLRGCLIRLWSVYSDSKNLHNPLTGSWELVLEEVQVSTGDEISPPHPVNDPIRRHANSRLESLETC